MLTRSAKISGSTINVVVLSPTACPLRELLLPNQVKRCDEMARKVRFFTEQVSGHANFVISLGVHVADTWVG